MSMKRGMWPWESWRCAGCYNQTLPVACPTAERKKDKPTIRYGQMDNSTSRQVLQNLFMLRRNFSVFRVGFSHTLDLSSDPAKKEMYREERYFVSRKCFNTLEAFVAQAAGDSW